MVQKFHHVPIVMIVIIIIIHLLSSHADKAQNNTYGNVRTVLVGLLCYSFGEELACWLSVLSHGVICANLSFLVVTFFFLYLSAELGITCTKFSFWVNRSIFFCLTKNNWQKTEKQLTVSIKLLWQRIALHCIKVLIKPYFRVWSIGSFKVLS